MSATLDEFVVTRRKQEEDIEIQFAAALASIKRGYFASARAEINGALPILDGIERKRGMRT